MKWIIKNLENDIKHKKQMLGTTPPTSWEASQEAWDLKEKDMIKDIESAVKILKEALTLL